MLFHRRAHRPGSSRNRQDQPANCHHGAADNGAARRAAAGQPAFGAGPCHVARGITQTPRRSPFQQRYQGVSHAARRAVSAGTVRAEIETQGINWSAGVLEYWSIGVLEYWKNAFRIHQYSNTPLLHGSVHTRTEILVQPYTDGRIS